MKSFNPKKSVHPAESLFVLERELLLREYANYQRMFICELPHHLRDIYRMQCGIRGALGQRKLVNIPGISFGLSR